jgi:predicted ATPase/DNA-binding CsgD family transcriptional regulator
VSLNAATTRPLLLSRYFGRDAARAELLGIIERSRLVTLVGAPGCGKTRLSLELVVHLAERCSADVRFVELAPVGESSMLASGVAAALGLRDQPDRSAEDALVEALADDNRLLVLDNCEHLLGAVAELAMRLLGACPSLRIVATSRSALGLRGERVWRVPPLDPGSAVELFRHRSGLDGPSAGSDRSADRVIDLICRRLDGLPLGIELAAAWAGVLTPMEIFDRLERALPLPSRHLRDTDPRHETMEATVEWSLRLLAPAEQLLFEQLSVFAGGFDLDAARAVATGDDVLDGLASLVDHSLVLADATTAETMRYRLLEPVRQCAEARLASRGARDAARHRHAEHYLQVARYIDAELRRHEPLSALSRLDEEEGNFRVALIWARRQADDIGLRLSTALAAPWAIRGRVNQARSWLDEMLEQHAGAADRRLRASGLARASRLAWRQRDYQLTTALLEESLAIERELGDSPAVARRLRSLALVAMARGDLTEAERLCRQSVSIFRSHGDRYGLTLALAFLGMTLQLVGEREQAEVYAREALDLHRVDRNVTAAIYSVASLAFGAIAAGDITRLRTHTAEVAELLRTLRGKHEDPSWLWWTAAALAGAERRYHAALRLAGAAEATARRDGLQLHEQLRTRVLPWLECARAQLGPAKTSELSAEGARLTLDELIDEALREPDRRTDPPLSPRELEIADLVAAGLTNSEIAERLVISTRTVESHVDHIKTKLGFARRARIVAWAIDRQNPRKYR